MKMELRYVVVRKLTDADVQYVGLNLDYYGAIPDRKRSNNFAWSPVLFEGGFCDPVFTKVASPSPSTPDTLPYNGSYGRNPWIPLSRAACARLGLLDPMHLVRLILDFAARAQVGA